MKKLFLLLFVLQFVSYGQKADGLEICFEVQKSLKGFAADKEADDALDEILAVIGAAKNFYLIPCDEINNALALTYKGERFILYDKDFIDKINKATNDWSGKFILAHEVGHHINGHTRDFLIASVLDDQTKEKQREEELEADEFAGFIVAKLGAKYNQIKELINTIAPEKDDKYSTHPNRSKRLEAIKKGFDKVTFDSQSVNNNTSVTKNYNSTPKPVKKQNRKLKNYFIKSVRFLNPASEGITYIPKSNWNYEVSKKYDYWKKYYAEEYKDPFLWKEKEKNYPLITRTSDCLGYSINNNSDIELALIITQEKLKFNHEYQFSDPDDPIKENLPFKSIAISLCLEQGGGTRPGSEIYDYLGLPKYIEWRTDDSSAWEDENYLKNYKIAQELGYEPAYEVYGKLNYIIDDNVSGVLYLIYPPVDPTRGDEMFGIHNYLTFMVISSSNPQLAIQAEEFIEALKKGRKLYLKFSTERNDINGARVYKDENGLPSIRKFNPSGWYNDYDIKNVTFEFDLSGSSKALQLD